MRRSVLILSLLIACVLITAGCVGTSDTDADTGGKPVVAVSIIPEETLVKAVVGDTADVIVMIPPGSSPENYEPTAKQMQKLTKAKIYFGIDVPSETYVLPSLNSSTKYVALEKVVSAAYPDRKLGTERDPHIWLSPKRAMVMVQEIADRMSEIIPENKELYQKNAALYIEKLKNLDGELTQLFSDAKGKTFLAEHPAFGYLADDYGLKMKVLEEDGKEATINHRMELEDIANQKGITTIFYQSESGGSQVAQFAESIGGKAVSLSPLSGDYIENLKEMAKLIAGAAR